MGDRIKIKELASTPHLEGGGVKNGTRIKQMKTDKKKLVAKKIEHGLHGSNR